MTTGRIVGTLLFLQLAGLIVPFILLLPLTKGAASYLADAAGASSQIKIGAFLLIANCALTIGITITAYRTFRECSEAMALWLLAASLMFFLMQAVDNVHVLSMLSLSRQYVHADGSDEVFQTVAAVVGSMRRWAHLTELFVIDGWIFLLYCILYRFTLVPRAVAVFGLATVILHFVGIPVRGFLDLSPVGWLGMPMALSHVTLATWLAVKGFREPGFSTERRANIEIEV